MECKVKSPFEEDAYDVKIRTGLLIFYEEINIHISFQETFGLPKDLKWSRHTGSKGRFYRTGGGWDDEIGIHKK